ncbi:DUF1839 family protein [Aliikangiella sp. IMCC44653]
MFSLLDVSPQNYQNHSIHTQERDWAETNCYVDVWIEQLHALGLEPIAAMPFTLSADFEGDQWTFFKFQLNDLYDLYGIEVQELVIWKELISHIEEQLNLGRAFLVELDSMYLPDTAGTAYQREHVKTTVSINKIDAKNHYLEYFHAQGYYSLEGEDFRKIFHLDKQDSSSILAPYVEIAKLKKLRRYSTEELASRSHELLKKQLTHLPEINPFIAFRERFETDFAWLLTQNIETFHQYCFVTFRQFGACFELAANYLNWLTLHKVENLSQAAQQFKQISEITKVYQFQLARSVSRGKPLDLGVIDKLAQHWENATLALKQND